MANIGASVGDSAYVDTNREFSIKNVALFKPNTTRVIPRYLYYAITSPYFQKYIRSAVFGSAQPFLGLDFLRSITLSLPPLPTQKKIASILSAYDDLIENNNRRIKILEEIAQNIYREWFVHFRYPGHENVPMVDSELGQIPQGWEVKQLGDFAELKKIKFDPNMDSDLPLVDLARINSKSLAISDIGTANQLSTSRIIFASKDVLFGSIRPYLHKVALAPFKGVTNTSVFVLGVKSDTPYGLLVTLLFSEDMSAWANQYSQGTKMPVIKWELLKTFRIAYPPKDIAHTSGEILDGVYDQIIDLQLTNQNLRKTRDLLLPKLISGQLDVEELDIMV